MPHVVVWDIETVPDLRGFAAANGLDGKSDHKTRAAIGDKLPTLPNRCIAATDAGKNTPSQSGRESHWQEFILRAPKTPGDGQDDSLGFLESPNGRLPGVELFNLSTTDSE